MKGKRYRVWPMLPQPELPAYLEQMERKGLRFERLRFWQILGEYTRVEPAETRYEWDYYITEKPEVQPEDELLEYQEFFEEAGWEIVWQFERSKIFREMPEKNPLPMHTDREIWLDKRRTYAKKYELYQSFWWVAMAAIIGWLIGNRTLVSFPIETALGEAAAAMIAVVLPGMALWYFINGLRYYRREGTQEHNLSAARAYLGVFISIYTVATVVFLFLVPVIEERETSTLAGLAIGLPIGSAVRRIYMGQGGDARKKGIKGIPNYSWRSTTGSIIIAAALIAVTFSPVFEDFRENIPPLRGANLYCSELYREGGDDGAGSYYLARDDSAAQMVVDAYLNRKQSNWWENRWRPAPDGIPEDLTAIGPYSIPRRDDAVVYWSPFVDDGQSRSGYYLIRIGKEIWFTEKPWLEEDYE